MTNGQGQIVTANRSRILNSIFSRSSRDTSASNQARSSARSQRCSVSTGRQAHPMPAGWRDVASRHARETLAERLCMRFFARATKKTVANHAPEAEFSTAGQRLQSLSQGADNAAADPQSQAVIFDAPVRSAGTALQDVANSGGSAQAGLTAKAA